MFRGFAYVLLVLCIGSSTTLAGEYIQFRDTHLSSRLTVQGKWEGQRKQVSECEQCTVTGITVEGSKDLLSKFRALLATATDGFVVLVTTEDGRHWIAVDPSKPDKWKEARKTALPPLKRADDNIDRDLAIKAQHDIARIRTQFGRLLQTSFGRPKQEKPPGSETAMDGLDVQPTPLLILSLDTVINPGFVGRCDSCVCRDLHPETWTTSCVGEGQTLSLYDLSVLRTLLAVELYNQFRNSRYCPSNAAHEALYAALSELVVDSTMIHILLHELVEGISGFDQRSDSYPWMDFTGYAHSLGDYYARGLTNILVTRDEDPFFANVVPRTFSPGRIREEAKAEDWIILSLYGGGRFWQWEYDLVRSGKSGLYSCYSKCIGRFSLMRTKYSPENSCKPPSIRRNNKRGCEPLFVGPPPAPVAK